MHLNKNIHSVWPGLIPVQPSPVKLAWWCHASHPQSNWTMCPLHDQAQRVNAVAAAVGHRQHQRWCGQTMLYAGLWGCKDQVKSDEFGGKTSPGIWRGPNEHPEIHSPGQGNRDAPAGLSQGKGWHTALCHGSAGKQTKWRWRPEANSKWLTGGEVAGAAPAPPAHSTLVALDIPTKNWTHQHAAPRDPACPHHCPTCSSCSLEIFVPRTTWIADSGRLLVEKITRALILLGKLWWSSVFCLHS